MDGLELRAAIIKENPARLKARMCIRDGYTDNVHNVIAVITCS